MISYLATVFATLCLMFSAACVGFVLGLEYAFCKQNRLSLSKHEGKKKK